MPLRAWFRRLPPTAQVPHENQSISNFHITDGISEHPPSAVMISRQAVLSEFPGPHFRRCSMCDDRSVRVTYYATGKSQHPKAFFFFSHRYKEVHIRTAVRTQSTKIMDWTDCFYAVRPNGRTGPYLGSPFSPDYIVEHWFRRIPPALCSLPQMTSLASCRIPPPESCLI